jgi:hypothetical protein
VWTATPLAVEAESEGILLILDAVAVNDQLPHSSPA